MSTQSNSHKPFLGVHFVLYGFGFSNQHQVKAKLVNGGGVDVGQYTQDCTHVIVHDLVYDDPLCVAARKDAKILVTDLWVDHSFDIGMPVDHTSNMYRPSKDLNGIPGAKSFIMCLTGYQRQDRDDVMTMVGLMGAQFSKPLVANKVTHLICYKFEGEKYELAKKIKRIKLVNHKWLEDCLNAWQILPEINYNRSGYELEMDIEAKDSEEEAEEVDNNPLQFKGRKMNSSPYSGQVGTSRTLGVQTPVGAVSKIPMDTNVLTGPSNFDKHDDILSVTGRYTSPGQLSSLKNVNEKHHEAPRRLKIENTMLAEQLVHCDMKNPSYAENLLNFTSTSVRKSHHSDMENSSGMIYSRKTPRKTTLQTENSNGVSDFSKMQSGKDEISGLYTSPSEAEQGMDNHGPGIFYSPLKGSDLLRQGNFTDLSPQKRKMDAFYASSKSQKTDHDLTPCTSANLTAGNKSYFSKSTPLTHYDLSEKNKGVSLCNDDIRLDDPALLNSAKQLPVDMLQPNFSSYGRKSLTNTPSVFPTVFSKIRDESNSEKAQHKTATFDSPEAGGSGELQNQQQDIDTSSPNCRATMFANSHIHIRLGGENDNLHMKSAEKTVAKKKLSSRGKLGLNRTANSVNKKGSIYLDKSASQNDTAACSFGGKGTVSHDKPSSANKSEDPSVLDNIETSMETNLIEDPKGRNYLKYNNESMDDETEAPDDPNIDVDEAVIIRSEVSDVPQKSDTNLKETSEEVHLTTKANTANTTPLETDHEKAVENNIELGESACITDDMKTKATKGRKRSLGKTKINTVRAVKKKSENETEALDPNINLEEAVIVRSVVSEVPKKSGTILKETSEEVHVTTKVNTANTTPLETNHEKAVDNNIELGETTCITDDMKSKATKGRKRSLGKSKINTDDAVKKKPENEKKNETEAHDPNIDLEEEVIIRSVVSDVQQKSDTILKETSEVVHLTTKASTVNTTPLKTDLEMAIDDNNIQLGESTCVTDDMKTKATKGRKRSLGKTKINTARAVKKKSEDETKIGQLDSGTKKICEKSEMEVDKRGLRKLESTIEVEKENKPMSIGEKIMSAMKTKVVTKYIKEEKGDKPATIREKVLCGPKTKVVAKLKKTVLKAHQKEKAGPAISDSLLVSGDQKKVKVEPMRFLLSGHRLQRKEFQKMIKQLKGKCCRDSHQWSYQATHIIVPEPLRRTEKLFAAAASGSWILNSDYLAASSQAGKFLAEESYEWHKNGLSEDGAINMEAPRKWRRLREKTGHGAFYGMRIVMYGECITPSLDTMKRAVKAGDGTILATAPPYTKFINTEKIDFAVVSPGMPRVDMWVQEFLKHEIPCVLADYLVEYVCKLGCSLERHVLYNTHTWAEKSLSDLQTRSEEIAEDLIIDDDEHEDDLACEICGLSNRGEVMLICGDENGSVGCGVGVHIDCCDPPLKEVPEEDWFCAKCIEAKNVSISAPKKTKKRSSKGR